MSFDNFSIEITEMISGKCLIFQWNDLAKYPESTLTAAVRFIKLSNSEKSIKFPVDFNTLSMIHYFYKNDRWKNPYYYENRLIVNNNQDLQITHFDDICDYLNLPTIIESTELENNSDSDYYSDEIDDDFNVYGEDDTDDEYYNR
jgi:hypothetical protein